MLFIKRYFWHYNYFPYSHTVLLEADEFCRKVHIEEGKDPIVCLEQELGKLGRDVRLEVGSPVPAGRNYL